MGVFLRGRRGGGLIDCTLIGTTTSPARERSAIEWLLEREPVCVAGVDGTLHEVSPAFEALLGFTLAELRARPLTALVDPGDLPRARDEVARLLAGEAVEAVRLRHPARDGRVRWLEWRAASPAGSGIVYALARDVTEEIERERRRDELTALVVHDLKNPLAALTVNASYLSEHGDPEVREVAGDMVTAADQMQRMILNLLDVASSEAGALVPKLVETDFGALVEGVVRQARTRSAAEGKHVDLTRELDRPVCTDPELVRRVLENLIDNALKYSPTGSRVGVEVFQMGTLGGVELRVTDQGPGIPAKYRAAVFDKFVRIGDREAPALRTSRGLGLAFCRMAVTALGGWIWVEDQRPSGCAFCVRLPAPAEGRRSRPPPGQRRTEPVLVVEDDDAIRESLVELLEDHGFPARGAANGRQALEVAQAEPPCLVLLDWMMPVMNAPQFLEAFRPARPTPIVIITAGGGFQPPRPVQGLLRKPLDVSELLRVVRQHCLPAAEPSGEPS